MFKIGQEVVRKKDRGTVVEIDERLGRARVYWHTYAAKHLKPKRTWVGFKYLKPHTIQTVEN